MTVVPPDPAERAPLGRTGLQVTRLGLGTGPIGNLYEAVSDEQATDLVRSALAAGVRLFDTAPLYGFGLAERRLGAGLAGFPRDEVVVATKAGRLLRPDGDAAAGDPGLFAGVEGPGAVFDFSYDAVLRSVEESLERLGMDRVDVVHLHDPDDHMKDASEDGYRALDRLRSEGAIGAVGSGANDSRVLAEMLRRCDLDCVLLAGRYSLLDRSALEDLLPLCAERSVSVIVGGVYNSGVLADPRGHPYYNYAPAHQDIVRRALALEERCAAHGVSLKAAAIQFPFSHPAVTSVLAGARSAAELEESLAALRTPVPQGLWEEIASGADV